MRVYTAQIVCEHSHGIVASAGEFESFEEAASYLGRYLRRDYSKAIRERRASGKCPQCGSRKTRVETAATIFGTLEEAAPFFMADAVRMMGGPPELRELLAKPGWIEEQLRKVETAAAARRAAEVN